VFHVVLHKARPFRAGLITEDAVAIGAALLIVVLL
jgi:hypothetical protein